jgi:hypothetical protein
VPTLALAVSALLLSAPTPPAPYSREVAERLVGGVITDPTVFARLAELTDGIGPRLTGSEGAARAVEWALARFRADGLEAHLEPVRVPHWVRGEERGELLAGPGYVAHPLALTALGGSAPTPDGGLTAEVIEVRSIDEARALGERARGKIVLFQHAMNAPQGYGLAGALRTRGPDVVGKLGAVAALVRSAASASMRSPHTGATTFEAGAPAIPAAAVSTEDAELIGRLLQRGPLRVHLSLGCRTLPDVDSANVVAEIKGRERPEEIVLMGAHLDSWDLATGAIDDGAGVAIVLGAMRALARLPERPRRTVRAVLFMNEENGLRGGKAYAHDHAEELARHVAAIEMDAGGGRVERVLGPGAPALLGPWLGAGGPLALLGVTDVEDGGHGGADLSPSGAAHVPMVDLRQEGSRYFDWHHSAADTLDKVEPKQLGQASASLAWVAYALAQMDGTLERRAPRSSH